MLLAGAAGCFALIFRAGLVDAFYRVLVNGSRHASLPAEFGGAARGAQECQRSQKHLEPPHEFLP
ncbi:uncharacterized protein STAUR_6293 [Stigmatella aurantiaca DW4/3-1]|uniref:Uncharacterized protein n=1 Tax=Stigmatella aurantiaca (strain DW4/3-1) TaxID=378806 RepID=E3FH20_STIAD|nr:uncharacterized protein STAUR_6293 [Stigmatella aurantiaca DW4/3-1]